MRQWCLYPSECWPEFTREQCGAEENAETIKPYCCKAWQVCGELYQCAPDPEAPLALNVKPTTNVPPRRVCSAGSCYAPSGRTACTTTAQCGADERCDLRHFCTCQIEVGVPIAMIIPKYAAKTTGSVILKQRVVLNKGPRMYAGNSRYGLPRRSAMSPGRCVQVSPMMIVALVRNAVRPWSMLFYLNNCESDDDCREGLKCSLVNNECVMPECNDDSDCRDWPYDSRYTCDANVFSVSCGPVCDTEADEPNETIGNTRPMENGAYSAMIAEATLICFLLMFKPGSDIAWTYLSETNDAKILNWLCWMLMVLK